MQLYKYLVTEHRDFVLSKQILRSGTSIGANIQEAQQAQSKKDFLSKMNIALKEANETQYWLRLLKDSSYLDMYTQTDMIIVKIKELLSVLIKIVKTTKQNINAS